MNLQVGFRAYRVFLDPKEPASLGLLAMISLYKSLKKVGFQGPGRGLGLGFRWRRVEGLDLDGSGFGFAVGWFEVQGFESDGLGFRGDLG